MFVVASFSVVGGLQTSMDRLMNAFSEDLFLVTMPGDSGPGFFSPSQLSGLEARSALGIWTEAWAEPANRTVRVFSLTDPHRVLPESLAAPPEGVLVGARLNLSGAIALSGLQTTVAGRYSSSLFPSEWVLAGVEFVQRLASQPGRFNFAVSSALTRDEISSLETRGFVVQGMTGIVPFLRSSVDEVESDAYLAIVPSAVAVGILAYSFVGAETADRRHDIGILKTLGAGRRRILSYLAANAVIVCAYGGLVGLALGIVLSYGVAMAASSVFASVFVIETSERLLLVAFLATVLAGLAGAMPAALRMTITSPIEDLREVTPYS